MNTLQTLQSLHDEINDILQIYETQFSGLSDEQMVWKPTPDKWSIAECLQHLNIANGYYVKRVNEKLEDAGAQNHLQADRFSLSFSGWLFVNYIIDPKAKYKFKAPKQVRPRKDIDIEKTRRKFIELLRATQTQLANAKHLNLDRIKIKSPFTGLLKFRLGDVFIITARHSRRHINQALRVKETGGFPL